MKESRLTIHLSKSVQLATSGKKDRPAYKFLFVNSRPQPVVKGVQIKPAQEDTSAANLGDHSPASARSVKYYENRCDLVESC